MFQERESELLWTEKELYDFEEARVDVVGRNCQETRQFDNNSTRAFDAHDGTFDTLERAVCDTDFLSFVKLVCDFLEVHCVITHDLADLDKVCHRFFGNNDRVSCRFIPHEMGRAVLPQCLEIVA